MNPTERFIALLEERELVSHNTAESLRAQVAESRKPISPESLAKRLVKHGRLTSTQAKRLLSALSEESPAAPPAKAKQKPAEKPRPEAKPKAEDELGFAPIDDEPVKSKRSGKRREREEKPAAQPRPEQPSKPAAAAPAPKPAGPKSLLDQEMPAAAPLGRPLDGLMSDAAMTATASGGPLSAAPSGGRGLFRIFRRKPKIKTGEEQWGSSLMLLGGGSLLLLLILGGALYWALSRSGGDEMLRLADEDYRGGSYAQAISKYTKYIEKFPNHAGVSIARVRTGLAQLRQATSGSNWPGALTTAEEVLKNIAPEKDFKEAHGELASMLPAIAEGLADGALKKTSQPLVDQARRAVEMSTKYVPKSLRPASKLAEVEAKLAVAERNIARDAELTKTIAAMLDAAKQSNTQAAYEACGALLRQYPKLADDAKLKEALLAVSRAQQALVKTVAAAKPPAGEQSQPVHRRSITPAQCATKTVAPDAGGFVALAAVDGSIYGLDAAAGKVLWRRFVGFETNPQTPSFPPTSLSAEPGSDALAADAARNELLRLEALTGAVRWRQPVGEPFDAHPVVVGEKILLAARSGKLFTIDAASGESPGYVQFPQELTVAPAVDSRRSLIFQTAVHSNLYVLSLNDGACRDVFYLGHGSGSVNTPPTVIDDFLLTAVNDGARDCVLKLFVVKPAPADKPGPWLSLVQQIRLGGHVKTPPLVDGRRVLVATAAGVVRVFEISATDVKMPLREIADTQVEGGSNLTRFLLLRSGRFWIADTRLTKYDVQAAAGRLMPKWIADQEGVFLQPPAVVGGALVCVQRRPGMPGAVVSAVSIQDPPEQYWRTQLGSPPAAAPLVLPDGGKIMAVTAAGGVYRFDAGGDGATVVNEPVAAPDATLLRSPINSIFPLAGGLMAISGGKGSKQIGVFDPAAPAPMIFWPEVHDELACTPAAFGRGILTADRAGRISLLDPKSGEPLAQPFQPRLEPGEKIEWVAPAIANDKDIIAANSQGKLYRLGVQDQPTPHLEMLAQTTLAKPIVTPLTAAGSLVFGADEANVLGAFDLAKLGRGKELGLDAHCAWGPVRVGDRVMLATENGLLYCIDAEGNQLWRTELKHAPLAGPPLSIGESYILVARDGSISRIGAADGKEQGELIVGIPLATGATPAGEGLLVGGSDGTIYEVRQP